MLHAPPEALAGAAAQVPWTATEGIILGLLSLLLGELGQAAVPAAAASDSTQGRAHQAVRRAMRLLESDIARPWTLAVLA